MKLFATCIKENENFAKGQQVTVKLVDVYIGRTKIKKIFINEDRKNNISKEVFEEYFELNHYSPISKSYLNKSIVLSEMIK